LLLALTGLGRGSVDCVPEQDLVLPVNQGSLALVVVVVVRSSLETDGFSFAEHGQTTLVSSFTIRKNDGVVSAVRTRMRIRRVHRGGTTARDLAATLALNVSTLLVAFAASTFENNGTVVVITVAG
jgi:hypothetical protein